MVPINLAKLSTFATIEEPMTWVERAVTAVSPEGVRVSDVTRFMMYIYLQYHCNGQRHQSKIAVASS